MIKLFILSFFLLISLRASDSAEILKRADEYMQSNSQSNIFRAYNDYKNIYLRSVINDDTELKIESLEGIVKSGNRLHIDVSRYSKELKTLSSNKESLKQKHVNVKKSAKAKDIHIKPLHTLKSVEWHEDTLLLEFDKELDKTQIKYFTLHNEKKKKYRYIFDIKTSMLVKSHNIKKSSINRIKLAQFDPNTVRLVIENDSELKLKDNINSSVLEIELDLPHAKKDVITQQSIKTLNSNRDKIIVIDAGHGGKDPGAIGYRRYREKIVVFKIARELSKILRSWGYRVYMTRDRDVFVKLSNRTKFANEKKANIFVSIHANAINGKNAKEVHGIECYFLSPSRSDRAKKVAAQENSADLSDMNIYGKSSYLNFLNHHHILASNKLAIDLQRGMLAELNKGYKGVKDGGVREGPFWVLVGAQMPSVLVEVGFISHPQEARRLVDNNYRKTMARGLADGIERYFANN